MKQFNHTQIQDSIQDKNLEIKIDHINHQLIITKGNEFIIKIFNTNKESVINQRIINILKAINYSL
jgi:hypothetical protein